MHVQFWGCRAPRPPNVALHGAASTGGFISPSSMPSSSILCPCSWAECFWAGWSQICVAGQQLDAVLQPESSSVSQVDRLCFLQAELSLSHLVRSTQGTHDFYLRPFRIFFLGLGGIPRGISNSASTYSLEGLRQAKPQAASMAAELCGRTSTPTTGWTIADTQRIQAAR